MKWFPDWSGTSCAIVAGGPSVNPTEVESLRSRISVIVINNAYGIAPWADVLYAADGRWWTVNGGAAGFQGLKVTPDRDAAKHFGLRLVELLDDSSDGISQVRGVLARGGHSGHQALNLAIQFGVKRIALLGYDFHGDHWHGRHEVPLRNPKQTTMEKWASRIDALAPAINGLGIEVVNCSTGSRLHGYARMTVAEMLEQWA